jgi:cytochrome P450
MLKLTQELFGPNDPDMNREHRVVSQTEAAANLKQIMLDLEDYFSKVTTELRANPRDCLNSLIANAKIDGKHLDHRQLMGYYIIAATAGHDTTSNTMAGALWALAERPDVFKNLKASSTAITGFIEESIRWVTPVKHFMRTASADGQFRGGKIAKGDWLMLSYHSANRDESEFLDPFVFDIARKPNKQIAFGYGPHVCLGQHLARLEMRILWEELLPRLQSLELAGEPKRTQSNFVCGPKTVPIRFKPS